VADEQRAQEQHEAAVLELAQTKHQLEQLASTRSHTEMDATRWAMLQQVVWPGIAGMKCRQRHLLPVVYRTAAVPAAWLFANAQALQGLR